jgi:uncharacterized protein (DUF2062 family)
MTPIRSLKADFEHLNIVWEGKNLWLLATNHSIAMGSRAAGREDAYLVFTDNHAPMEFLLAIDFVRQVADVRD